MSKEEGIRSLDYVVLDYAVLDYAIRLFSD